MGQQPANLDMGGFDPAAPVIAPAPQMGGLGIRTATPAADGQGAGSDPLRVNQALQRAALAKRDLSAFNQLNESGRRLKVDTEFGEATQRFLAQPEFYADAIRGFNKSSTRVTFGKPDAKGFSTVSVVDDNGDADVSKLSRADQAKLYAASQIMASDPMRALDVISSVNKELAAAVAAENKLKLDVGKEANDSAYRRGALNETERHHRAAEGQAAAGLKQSRMGAPVQMLDKDGNAVLGIPVMGRDGRMTFEQVDTGGLRFPRQTMDPKTALSAAEKMVGTPTGRKINGAPETHTIDSAYAAIMSMDPSGARTGGAPNPYAVGQGQQGINPTPVAKPAPATRQLDQGDLRLKAAAEQAGLRGRIGSDGQLYFQGPDGGPIMEPAYVAKQLGLVY